MVGRGGAHKVRREVTEARSLLKWEFISTDYDIAFQVYHKSDGNRKEEVVSSYDHWCQIITVAPYKISYHNPNC